MNNSNPLAQFNGLANHIVSNSNFTVIKMGKNKNNAASAAQKAAAAQAAPGTEQKPAQAPESTKVDVIQVDDLMKVAASKESGMDLNHVMDMIRVTHETFHSDPKAAEHTGIPQETVDKMNRIKAIELVALHATMIVTEKTPFAVAVRTAMLPEIIEAATSLGIVINQKALPAPDNDGKVVIPPTAMEIPKEKKEEIKKEDAAAAKKVELDPTKIDSEEKLKDSLLNILVKGEANENLYDKISKAINFYESYLGIQANKAENVEEAVNALKSKSRVDLFTEIANMLGKCPFTLGGVAKFMYENTERTKSPVVAFCTLRDASLNKKTGMPQVEDQFLADIVRVLINWYANTEITVSKETIEGFKRDIEALKKDEKKNAKGIETGKKKIQDVEKHIEDVRSVITYVLQPSRDVVDNFVSNYTDNKAEGYKLSRMIGSKIAKTYYPGIDVKSVDMESFVNNLQQYMGIITNMFLPAMDQFADYSEGNITELKKAEAPAESEEKNA